jgi:hypothetical protein
MSNWADYGISDVKYNREHTHIEKVKVHEDPGGQIASGKEWLRTDVVSFLNRKITFVTIFKKNGDWRKGQRVRVVPIKGGKYIRTDKDDEEDKDDLGDFHKTRGRRSPRKAGAVAARKPD